MIHDVNVMIKFLKCCQLKCDMYVTAIRMLSRTNWVLLIFNISEQTKYTIFSIINFLWTSVLNCLLQCNLISPFLTWRNYLIKFLQGRKSGSKKIIFSFFWIIYLTLPGLSKTKDIKTTIHLSRTKGVRLEVPWAVFQAVELFEMDEIWVDSWHFLNWKKKGMIFSCFCSIHSCYFSSVISPLFCVV